MNALFANEMKETREFYLEEISNKKTVSTKKRFLTKCRLQAEDVLIDRERAYNAGQKPHYAYAAGMSRLSCSFCIMASKSDLCTAAALRPEMYRRLAELEKKINHTMSMSGKSLEEITGIAV